MTKLGHASGNQMEYTVAGSPVTADTVELVNDTLGVHAIDAAVGETAVLLIEGTFDGVPKLTGEAWSAGDNIYWHDGNGQFQANATGATLRGKAMADAAIGAATGRVKLVPGLA